MEPKKFSAVFTMEGDFNGRTEILCDVYPGDYTIENGWKLTVTEAAKNCDCGKGMYCPYVIQEKV